VEGNKLPLSNIYFMEDSNQGSSSSVGGERSRKHRRDYSVSETIPEKRPKSDELESSNKAEGQASSIVEPTPTGSSNSNEVSSVDAKNQSSGAVTTAAPLEQQGGGSIK